jgi:3-oxoacyl-[acyl-carrier protein] reductase
VSQGARVMITGRTAADLESAQSRLGPSALSIAADARRAEDVERAVQATVDGHGGLDVLVNNAGVGIFKNAADMSAVEWQSIIDTNLTGVFYYCHAAIPHLRRRGGGWIVNISSLAGKNPFIGGAAYCASKAGLNAFSEALMQEVRYDNIRVTYVMPGSVATGFGGRGAPEKADWKIQPEDVGQVVLDLLSMPPRSLPSRVELRPSQPQKH